LYVVVGIAHRISLRRTPRNNRAILYSEHWIWTSQNGWTRKFG
jgi:hypothetical protein